MPVLLNLLISIIFKKHVIFRAILAIILGIVLSIAKFIQAPGIIDPVYFFILSTTFACVLGVYKGACFTEMLKDINEFNEITEKLIKYVRDGYKYILGKAFQERDDQEEPLYFLPVSTIFVLLSLYHTYTSFAPLAIIIVIVFHAITGTHIALQSVIVFVVSFFVILYISRALNVVEGFDVAAQNM